MDEVGRVLANISNVVPGGIVVFFPSYDYEKLIYSHWEKTGVIARLGAKKKVFREPRKANQVDFMLGQYTSVIKVGRLVLIIVKFFKELIRRNPANQCMN